MDAPTLFGRLKALHDIEYYISVPLRADGRNTIVRQIFRCQGDHRPLLQRRLRHSILPTLSSRRDVLNTIAPRVVEQSDYDLHNHPWPSPATSSPSLDLTNLCSNCLRPCHPLDASLHVPRRIWMTTACTTATLTDPFCIRQLVHTSHPAVSSVQTS